MLPTDSDNPLSIRSFLERCGLCGQPGPRVDCGPFPPTLPLVDVRSPAEFQQGHIPGAVNIPLFSDSERAKVGTVYKTLGRDEAVVQGLAFVGPRLEAMARAFLSLAAGGRDVAVYCSRGGMRSGSVAWLMRTLGLRAHVLEGGYKTFRRHVLAFFSCFQDSPPYALRVLGGRTGSGKTEVLRLMAEKKAQVVDLEGLARHRGSAFGALEGIPQPSNEHFENLLALALKQCDPAFPVWVEDECENLGRINLPGAFFRCLRAAPLAVLEVPHEARLARVLADYGDTPKGEMLSGIDRIRKRLGGLEHKRAQAFLEENNMRELAEILLAYYDRAYEKQLRCRTPYAVVNAVAPADAARDLFQLRFRAFSL